MSTDRFAHLPKTELACEVEIVRLTEKRQRLAVRGVSTRETVQRIAGTARLRDWLHEQAEAEAFAVVAAASERRSRAQCARFASFSQEAW